MTARLSRRDVLLSMLAIPAVGLVLSGCRGQAVLTGVSVTPRTITPDGKSAQSAAAIRYDVNRPADVTVAIVSASGKSYVLRDKSTRPSGSYLLTFPGAIDGRVLPDGDYTVKVQASAPGKQTVEQQLEQPLAIRGGDSTPPVISEVMAFPPEFHPNGNLATDVTTIHYTLSKPALVNVFAVGKQLGQRFDIVFNQRYGAGPQVDSWKGLAGNVDAVPDDDYVVHIAAQDAAGNTAEQTTMVMVRDSGIPQARIVGVRFSVETNGADKLLRIEVQVLNEGTAILYTWGPKPGYIYPSTHSTYLTPAPDGPGLPEEMEGRAGKYSVGVDFVRQPQDPPPYPWRWSFGKDLRPKDVATVVGFVKLDPRQPGDYTLFAGLIHEGQGIASGQDHMGQQVVSVR